MQNLGKNDNEMAAGVLLGMRSCVSLTKKMIEDDSAITTEEALEALEIMLKEQTKRTKKGMFNIAE